MNIDGLDSRNPRQGYQTVNEIFPDWEHDSRILFLAIEMNHHDYSLDTAHTNKTILPVFILTKRRRDVWRRPQEDTSIAEELADLHNSNGFDAAVLPITIRVLSMPIPGIFMNELSAFQDLHASGIYLVSIADYE